MPIELEKDVPRPKSINWSTRVAIFVSYRRVGQKAYPVARHFRIARSTTGLIVKEFVESGFSVRPRAELSVQLLARAQELHLEELAVALQEPRSISLPEPADWMRTGLEGQLALSDGLELEVPGGVPFARDEALDWHLRETAAEGVVSETNRASLDYRRRCLRLWRDIAADIEEACRLPVQAYRQREAHEDPAIFDGLIDELYRLVFVAPATRGRDPAGHLHWDSSDATQLRCNSHIVAGGQETDHRAIQDGVTRWLTTREAGYEERSRELVRLHDDLRFLQPILREALEKVTDDEVRSGICPACPYPEANADIPGPPPKPTRRR